MYLHSIYRLWNDELRGGEPKLGAFMHVAIIITYLLYEGREDGK